METTLADGKKTVRPKPGHVNQVRENWRSFEDHSLASQMQNDEFACHYDKNKSERMQMRTDVPMSKGEQKLEDEYAQEYWEQVRRDREKDDEKLAVDLQRKLDLENELQKQKLEQDDKEVARSLMENEQQDSNIKEMQAYLGLIGDELPEWEGAIPGGMTQNQWNTVRIRRRQRKSIEMPQDPNHKRQVQLGLEKIDAKIAQEEQDKYLAEWLDRRERKHASKEVQQNHTNEASATSSSVRKSNPPPRPPPPNVSRPPIKGGVRVLPP